MRNFNVDVIYVEGDSTSPFFSAEASLCPREAGEREKSAREMIEGERGKLKKRGSRHFRPLPIVHREYPAEV